MLLLASFLPRSKPSTRFSSLMKKITIDISPLRKYRDFRLIWSAGFVSYFGSMITYVALPFQIKELTNSYIAVGLMGAVELIPLIVFSLYDCNGDVWFVVENVVSPFSCSSCCKFTANINLPVSETYFLQYLSKFIPLCMFQCRSYVFGANISFGKYLFVHKQYRGHLLKISNIFDTC